ncbi:MAG TPA: FecR domain-containing protein [Puia sp.]|nr:FecR domain-containing protein [Puia sp.]
MKGSRKLSRLILKFVRKKKLKPSEMRFVQEWLDRSEYHRAVLEKFSNKEWVWDGIIRMQQAPAEKGWQRLEASLDSGWKEAPGKESKAVVIRYAVAVSLTAAAVWGGWMLFGPRQPIPPAHPIERQMVRNASPGEKTKNTKEEVSSTLALSDGSKIILNYASSIKYTPTPDGRTREVSLTGRAYFNIKSNNEKPFVVHVNDIRVEVLGTEFLITAYPEESAVQIALFKGSVRLIVGENLIQLRANEQVKIVESEVIKMPAPDRAVLMAWNDDEPRLFFDRAELTSVLREIARRYGVTIINPKNIKGGPVTGKISLNDELEQTLHNIELVEEGSVHLQKRGKTIVVSNKLTIK